MERIIEIDVKSRIARLTSKTVYVCGNTDYAVRFTFTEDWDKYPIKTARFIPEGQQPIDVVFEGDTCPVPKITNAYHFHVGVYAGDLYTTTPARVPATKSILCGSGAPQDPPKSVYDQIMEKLNGMGGGNVTPEAIKSAVDKYLEEHPIEGGGSLSATDDGKGNVTLTVSGGLTVRDDGKGNVVIG